MKTLFVCMLAVYTVFGLNPVILNMKANTWYEIPNSHMRQVEAKDSEFPGIWAGNAKGCHGVLNGWSGGIFDSRRNRLVVWGGGHHMYYGNEIYVFDVDDFKWTRLTNPSPPNDPYSCLKILPYATPVSRHTYCSIEYIPFTDRMFAGPLNSTSCLASGFDTQTWMFDFDTTKWMNPYTTGWKMMFRPAPDYLPHETSNAAAWDPMTNKVYYVTPSHTEGLGGIWTYDIAGNTWEQKSADISRYWGEKGGTLDYKRGILFIMGDGRCTATDIRNWSFVSQAWSTSGNSGNVISGTPGINYDPVADRIVGWDGGYVCALNPDTRTWEAKSYCSQAPAPQGTYGRFRFMPKYNAYILLNDVDKNILIYKMTEGPGFDPLDIARGKAGLSSGMVFSAHPNPLRSRTTLTIMLPGGTMAVVNLEIFDIRGRRIANLSRQMRQSKYAVNKVVWNAAGAAPGMYYARLRANGRITTKPLIIVR